MRLPRPFLTALHTCALVLPFCCPAIAASFDGVIDTAHVSHVGWQDRRPLCPVDGEPFEVDDDDILF